MIPNTSGHGMSYSEMALWCGRNGHLGSYRVYKDIRDCVDDHGKIRQAKHILSHEEFAIKIIYKKRVISPSEWERVNQEISIRKQLNHPSIVKLYDVIENDKFIGLVMKYAKGGELFEYVVRNGNLEDSKAKMFFAQLISGVRYMHRKKIVHRNIKLENLLLLDDKHLIITEFDLADFYDRGVLSERCGSLMYAPPEVMIGIQYAGPPVDIWSCGVVLYAMLCGYLPLDVEYISHLVQMMLDGSSTFPYDISEDALDLLRRMLEPDPAFRCSVDEVISHPWLEEHRAFLESSMHDEEEDVKKTLDNHTTTNSKHVLDATCESLHIKSLEEAVDHKNYLSKDACTKELDDIVKDQEGCRLLWDPTFLLLYVPEHGTKMHLVKPACDVYHRQRILKRTMEDDNGRHLLPHYALSHLWGLSKTDRPLWHDIADYVDDEYGEPAAAIPMRPEKRETLLRLLESYPDSYWWIDVLCARTETPLGIMGDIYACCTQCIAMIDCSPSIIPSMHNTMEKQQQRIGGEDGELDQFWEEVNIWNLFAQCNWWKRVWTWQEMVLPKAVAFVSETADQVSASHMLNIEDLDLSFTLFWRLSRRLKVEGNWKKELSYKWLTEIKVSRRYSLSTAASNLPSSRYFKHFKLVNTFAKSPRRCMNPVDYVYGVLGVLGFNIERKTDPKEVWQLFLTKMQVSADHRTRQFDLSTARNMADVYEGLAQYDAIRIG